MKLTMLDNGVTYLQRTAGNRSRMVLGSLVFSDGYGYEIMPNKLALRGSNSKKRPIDKITIVGDNVAIQVILDESTALDYGEVGLLSPEGGILAVAVWDTLQRKEVGTVQVLNFTLDYDGIGHALTRPSSTTTRLMRTRTDYDDVLQQLQASALQTNKFDVLAPNSTGTTLLELMAGITDFNSYMIESAFQETLPSLAKLDTSIYSIQHMLKNRLVRKTPAGISVTLTREPHYPSAIIPALSQFELDGVPCFNRESISLTKGQTLASVRLYEGEVKTYKLTGSGKDFEFWLSPDKSFTVSDTDVRVYVNGVAQPIVDNGIWEYKGKPAIQDFTYKDGALILTFGNSTYGTMPEKEDKIDIIYAVTSGESGNQTGYIGKDGTCARFPEIKIVAESEFTGGGNQPTASAYANFGGDLYGARSGAVTPSQYRALARTYPGVKDAIVLAQRDLAPMDKDWFNTGKIILLTSDPWSDEDINNFETWFRRKTWYGMRWIINVGRNGEEPKPREVNVKAKIWCAQTADLEAVQKACEDAVNALFVPRYGILARPVYKSDIWVALKDTFPSAIDFIQLDTPDDDISMYLEMPDIFNYKIEQGGTLPIGYYRYAVTAVDSDGQSRVNYVDVKVTEPNSKVTLFWKPVKSALKYNVFGRSRALISDMGLLYTTEETSWTDDGTLTGTNEKPPSINTSGVHYGVAGNIDIVVDYSSRSKLEDNGYGIS